jgi:hypothetical protein
VVPLPHGPAEYHGISWEVVIGTDYRRFKKTVPLLQTIEAQLSSASPVSALTTFLEKLASEGLALVDRTERLEVQPATIRAWQVLELAGRADLPGEPPPCDEAAGLWGAQRLFFACQSIVCRDLDTDEVRPRVLATPLPKRSPAVDYSVDVCLRYLPEVAHLARKLAAADPVNALLRELASEWPLSAVGVEQVEFSDVGTFWDEPVLQRLFADRVIARQCAAALHLPEVANAVRAALGAHEDGLAPSLAARLKSVTSSSSQS